MGDVSDAMDRARREQGRSSAAPKVRQDDSAPALPVEEVVEREQQIDVEEPRGIVAAAAGKERAYVSDALDVVEAHAPLAGSNAALNGYSNVIVTHYDRGSLITEQYRAIRTQILARSRNRRLQVTVLTSASPDEGKSVTTINLGVTFGELRNQRTLLVEGDLRRPTFAKLLHRDPSPGLVQLLKGDMDRLEDVVHPTVYDNLQVIPAGGSDAINSTELLSSPRMVQLLDRAKDRYDHIFVDTPPVLSVTDASILGQLGDHTILVVRLNKTTCDMVERTKRLLRAANCEVAGVVLTHLAHPSPGYLYRYRYRYSY